MIRITRVFLFASLAVLIGALELAPFVAPVQAQSQSLFWERYDVAIIVQDNGDLRVEETQVINFVSGRFQEGFAELSTANTDGISDVTVSEPGRDYVETRSTFAVDDGEYAVAELENGNLEVVWGMGPTEDEVRTFILAYTVRGAIRRYEQGNEFQWNAIAPGLRDFEVRESTVTVELPEGANFILADYLVPPEFPGVPMEVTQSGNVATWVAEGPINPSEGIQIAVQFPPGTIGGAPPSWQAEFDRRNAWEDTWKPWVDLGLLALGFILLLGGPALLYLLWYVRGRDPKIDAVPEYITAPPQGVAPGMAGTLVDERADVRDVIASLMDLARRGFLVIEETQESSPSRLVGKEFTFRKTGEDAKLNELNAYERLLYDSLFRGRDTVRMRDLNQRFYATMANIQERMMEVAWQEGFMRARPASVRSSYGCFGGLLLAGAVVVGFFALGAFADWTSTILCPFLGLAVTAIALIWLGRHMPVKTRKGAEAVALTRAFRNYMANLEKYADPKAVTDQFEKYLPWAIAFGLDRTWINRFRQIPATPMPGWYYPVGRPYPGSRMGTPGTLGYPGGGLGSPAGGASAGGLEVPSLQDMSDRLSGGLQGMSDSLNTMLNSAARTMTSTPPPANTSSGGRSFSGGRGGGFRGGGGGGFRASGGSGGGRRGFR